MSHPHVDKGGLPSVQHSITHTLFLCGERLRGHGCVLLETRKPLAVVLDLAQNTSPCRDFCWMEVVHSKSLWISKLAENCSLEKFKGYSEYDAVKEGIVSCTQTVSAHFRYFHSNNNTIFYSGHTWLAYVYNESSSMHQTEQYCFRVIAIYIIQTPFSWTDLWKSEA